MGILDLPPKNQANRQKRYRENHPSYEKERSDMKYLNVPFIAWDGEGYDLAGKHRYAMLANSDGSIIVNPMGLPTEQILEMLCNEAIRIGKAHHVIFGGSYDFNMFLTDLTRRDVVRMHKGQWVRWHNKYLMQWRTNRTFFVKRLGDKHGITISDVMPFFQSSFVKACRDYLGENSVPDTILSGKAARGTFNPSELPTIIEYNKEELRLLVALCDELRFRLNKAKLRPIGWYGCGAIAASLLKQKGIKNALPTNLDDHISRISQYAYAGGRFENIKCGSVLESPAFEYDRNSAYPYAMGFLPNLSKGLWRPISFPWQCERESFAAFNVRLCLPKAQGKRPSPLYRRHINGTISYPLNVEGWYWMPEILAAMRYVDLYGGTLDFLGGVVFEPSGNDKPFAFVADYYDKRRELKAKGDGAHVAYKLGLNSLYGKLAQQIGYTHTEKGLKLPAFHCLSWAGYITSHCRAAMLNIVMENLDNVIAFETDAVFTTVPLDVPVSPEMGDFEMTEFESLTYIASGLYEGRLTNGKEIIKTRGVNRGSVPYGSYREALKNRQPYIEASQTRFIGAGYANHTDWNNWQQWHTGPKMISTMPMTGKRWHLPCNDTYKLDIWHPTFCPVMDKAPNEPYPLAWLKAETTDLIALENDLGMHYAYERMD